MTRNTVITALFLILAMVGSGATASVALANEGGDGRGAGLESRTFFVPDDADGNTVTRTVNTLISTPGGRHRLVVPNSTPKINKSIVTIAHHQALTAINLVRHLLANDRDGARNFARRERNRIAERISNRRFSDDPGRHAMQIGENARDALLIEQLSRIYDALGR